MRYDDQGLCNRAKKQWENEATHSESVNGIENDRGAQTMKSWYERMSLAE